MQVDKLEELDGKEKCDFLRLFLKQVNDCLQAAVETLNKERCELQMKIIRDCEHGQEPVTLRNLEADEHLIKKLESYCIKTAVKIRGQGSFNLGTRGRTLLIHHLDMGRTYYAEVVKEVEAAKNTDVLLFYHRVVFKRFFA